MRHRSRPWTGFPNGCAFHFQSCSEEPELDLRITSAASSRRDRNSGIVNVSLVNIVKLAHGLSVRPANLIEPIRRVGGYEYPPGPPPREHSTRNHARMD